MIYHCKYDELVDPSTLKDHPKNRNKHDQEQIERLAKIIGYQGWRYAIKVSNLSGFITTGHGRKLAALFKGWDRVPVVYQDYTDADQEYADVQADNAIASWAELDLAGINLDVPDLGPDFDIDVLGLKGFVVEPADKYGDQDADAVPEVKQTDIKRGDLFQLGSHRLLCGDATSEEDVERLMDGEKADMAFLDPPYNTGMTAKKNAGSTRLTHFFDDSFTEKEWDSLLNGFLKNLYEVLKKNSIAYICLDWRRSHELVPKMKALFKFSNLIIWDKVVHGLGSDYKYTHEFIHVCKKGSPRLNTHVGEQEYQDIWHIQRKVGADEDHATKKPTALVERCLIHASRKNDLVVDLFMGSGSTLLAAEKNSRRCFGLELEPVYIQTAIDRWEKFTGQKAVKLE